MPFMRQWTEIAVDEDLLVPVVRELLDMAVNPNQVEVVHGTDGRLILAEAHLAEHWYQERLKRDETRGLPEEDSVVLTQTEIVTVTPAAVANLDAFQEVAQNVHEHEVAARSIVPIENTAQASTEEPQDFVPHPVVRRGPGRPRKEPLPSASPDGEDS